MNITNKKNLALLEAFVGYGIFGFSFIMSKSVLKFTDPYVLLGLRFALVFIVMNLLLLTGKFTINLKGKPVGYLFLLGIFQPIIYFSCEMNGIKLLNTSLVGVLLALTPLISMVLAIIFFNEKVNTIQKISVIISIIGVALTTIGQGETGGFNLKGFLLIMGAVIAAATYNLISRKSSSSFNAFEMTYAMFTIGFIYFSAVALFKINGNYSEMLIQPLLKKELWLSLIYLSCISSVGAFLLLNHAVSYLSVSKISVFTNVTTIISILAGVFILKENFTIFQILGSIIIILGVYGANKDS